MSVTGSYTDDEPHSTGVNTDCLFSFPSEIEIAEEQEYLGFEYVCHKTGTK